MEIFKEQAKTMVPIPKLKILAQFQDFNRKEVGYIFGVLLLWIISDIPAYSQSIDSVNIAKANKMIYQFFDEELIESNYILYSIGDKYILIREMGSGYQIFYVKDNIGIEKKTKISKNKLLRRAFDETSCLKKFVYSQSDSLSQYRHPHSQYIYYYLSKGGNKKCEFNLPIFYTVNVSRINVYPLDESIQQYLSKKFFAKWKE